VAVLNPDAVIDFEDETAAVIRHDARNLPLDDGTVDLIATSPPYFALRSYRDDGVHYPNQIGSEDTPDEWLDALDECMVEWGRVLKPSGSIFVNLGDKYAAGHGGSSTENGGVTIRKRSTFAENPRERPDLPNPPASWSNRDVTGKNVVPGFRPKSLMGLPWRFAIRQIDNGWILRAEVVWDKPNGLPESVTDRVRRSHETWFHFVKEPRYFSGIDEIREPHAEASLASDGRTYTRSRPGHNLPDDDGYREAGMQGRETTIALNPLGRLPGSVWTIPSEPLLIPDDTRKLLDLPDHFAAFPQEWPRRIILGWSPTGICTECGEGRRPVMSVEYEQYAERATNRRVTGSEALGDSGHGRPGSAEAPHGDAHAHRFIDSYSCACPTPDAPTTPSIILDPMGGTGTVAGVARILGRYGISNDLSADYNKLAQWRIWDSGHFTKTEQRTWADRQGSLL